MFLTPDAPPDEFVCRVLRIPKDTRWLGLVSGALRVLEMQSVWEQYGDLTPEETAQIFKGIFQAYYESDACMIGDLRFGVWAAAPINTLFCDGATYDRVDYPQLYEVMDTAYHINADTFKVPDYRGRSPLGFNEDDLWGEGISDYPMNTELGEEKHTLTVSELAIHTHSIAPHYHGYNAPATLGLIATLDAGVPISVPQAFPTITDAVLLTTDDTGSDGEHENRHPVTVCRVIIQAK